MNSMNGRVADAAAKGLMGMFVLLVGCSVLPLIISCTYMGLYWGLYTVAADFDDKSDGDGMFDRCFIMSPAKDENGNTVVG